MKAIRRSTLGIGMALSLAFGPIAALHAQTKSQDQGPTDTQRAISNNELKAFAKAYVQFHKIRADYEPKLSGATSPQEKGQVEQEAVAKFGAVLAREGLSMQRYAALYQTISSDQQLRDKALRLIEEERARS
jgi:Domain of unknown function (DUF4168)